MKLCKESLWNRPERERERERGRERAGEGGTERERERERERGREGEDVRVELCGDSAPAFEREPRGDGGLHGCG